MCIMFTLHFVWEDQSQKGDYISTNITDIAYTAEIERTGKKNTVDLTLCVNVTTQH